MKRHLAYLKMVLKHKWCVFLACRVMGVPWWIGIVHDWQKFLPRQWTPYVHNFYNADGTKRKVRDATGAYDPNAQANAFKRAWLDHQRAKHHWQAWCVIGDGGKLTALPMPEIYIREMIADWMCAGKAYDNYDPKGWYAANKNKMILHGATRLRVETFLDGVPEKF